MAEKTFNEYTEDEKQRMLISFHTKVVRGERDPDQDPIKDPEAQIAYTQFLSRLASDGLSEPQDFLQAVQFDSVNPRPASSSEERFLPLAESLGLTPTITTESGITVPNPYIGSSIPELAIGAGETALSMVSGAYALGKSGYNILESMISPMFTEEKFYDSLRDAVREQEDIMGSNVYTPQTTAGKDITAATSAPFLLYDQMTSAAGEQVKALFGGDVIAGTNPADLAAYRTNVNEIFRLRDAGETVPQELYDQVRQQRESLLPIDASVDVNYPAIFASVSTKTFLDLLPDIIGGGRVVAQNRRLVNDYKRIAEENNIDITGLTDEQIKNAVDRAKDVTGRQTARGERMGTLQQRLQARERHSRNVSQQLFDAAKSEDAYFAQLELKVLDGSLANMLDETAPEFANTRIARNRLQQFSEMVRDPDIFDTTGAGEVHVNRIHNFRQVLNSDIRRLPNRKNRSYQDNVEYESLIAMRDHIDNFMEDQMLADMVSGSPEAIAKWKDANQWYRDYKTKFTDQSKAGVKDFAGRAVEAIVRQNLTPEAVRNIILGAREIGGKDTAALVVSRLNDIFGNDSAQMNALRQEVIFGIVTPLLDPGGANVGQFLSNYERFRRGNMSLIEELFQGERLESFNKLVEVTRAMDKVAREQGVSVMRRTPQLERYLVANLVSADLAAASARQVMFQNTLRPIIRTVQRYTVGEKSDTRLIMQELYGVDVGGTPFAQINTFPYFSAVSTTREAEEAQTGESMPRIEGFIREFDERQRASDIFN